MPRNKIARSYSNSFNFLRTLHDVFHSGSINLDSYQECGRKKKKKRIWEDSLFSTPSPAFIVCRLFDDDHFPIGSVVKNPPSNAGDIGSIPGSGRSSGEGNGNPPQYSCLGNPMNRRNLVGYSVGVAKESHMT